MTPDLWEQIRWFKQAEFDSPDEVGSGSNMSPRVLFMLDAMRSIIKVPFSINSGYRTPSRNKSVGGAPGSAHMLGEACDISTHGWSKDQRIQLMDLAKTLGFTGIGVAPTYIHIDIHPRVARWRYVGKKTLALKLGEELNYA